MKEKTKLNINLASWPGTEFILSYEPIRVRFDYPLTDELILELAGPVTVGRFMDFVARNYKEIYRQEDETPGKYGIWGHKLEDLYLESTYPDDDGIWVLGMGS